MDIRKQLIILILVLLCAPVSAQKKEKLITLKFTNIPLSEAMPKVEKQSGYTFFYESQQIDIKQKVSLNVKNETINKTIAALLKGTNVKFEIDATHIILYTGKNNKAISGQPQNISGTVIDESGEPIIGANVMVEGTSTGVITDLDGKYTINAPAGSNLKISYIGYVTQTVKAGRNSTVKLVEDSKTLAEVVCNAFLVIYKFAGTQNILRSQLVTAPSIFQACNVLFKCDVFVWSHHINGLLGLRHSELPFVCNLGCTFLAFL